MTRHDLQKIKNFLMLHTLPVKSEAYWESYSRKIMDRLRETERQPVIPLRRWAAAFSVFLILFTSGAFYYRKVQERRKIRDVVAHLDLLENLDLLSRDDFERLTKQ